MHDIICYVKFIVKHDKNWKLVKTINLNSSEKFTDHQCQPF